MIQTMVWNVPYVIVIIVEAIIRYSLCASTLDHVLHEVSIICVISMVFLQAVFQLL